MIRQFSSQLASDKDFLRKPDLAYLAHQFGNPQPSSKCMSREGVIIEELDSEECSTWNVLLGLTSASESDWEDWQAGASFLQE
jgi:hypothetical protein